MVLFYGLNHSVESQEPNVSFFARVSNMSGGRGRGWLLWNEQLKETFILFILLRLTAASGSFAAQQLIWWLITDTNSWHFMTITEHLWKTGNVSVHTTALPLIRIFIFKQMNVTWFNSAKLQKQDAGKKKGKSECKMQRGACRQRHGCARRSYSSFNGAFRLLARDDALFYANKAR